MGKELNELLENIDRIIREYDGDYLLNNHARYMAYDIKDMLKEQLKVETPELTQDQVDEYLRDRCMTAIGIERLVEPRPYKQTGVLKGRPLRYGVGDKVILLDDLYNQEEYGEYPFNQKTMTKLQRGLHKIIRVEESTNSYRVYDGKDDWGITDKMVDHDKTALLNRETRTSVTLKGIKVTIEEVK